MDEFHRLKVMYPTASPRELAEFQVFAKAVAARREDGRGSEDRGEDNCEDTGDDRRRGRHSQQELQGPPRAPPPWPTFCGDLGGTRRVIVPVLTSLYPSRRDRRRRSRRCRKEKTQDRSAESASRASYSTS